MRGGRLAMAGMLGFAITVAIHAQEALQVTQAQLSDHVSKHVAPVYPPIAKAARVQGTVTFNLRIDAKGAISSMKVAGGPPMLQQAAIDCLKQWTFKPFLKDGKAVEAEGPFAIIFSLGKDAPTADEEKLAEKYFPESDECRKEVSAHVDTAKAAEVCVGAAEDARKFPEDRRFIEKRSAYVWATWALLYHGDGAEALQWAQRAVDIAKLGHDDNSGNNAVYTALAVAEAKNGDLNGADRDFETAEDFGKKAIAWAISVKFEHLDSYKRAMNQDLRLHAQVLQALNRPDDAKKKLDEATKYE
jgi:TonB family protein